jgi:hypothetical protein
MELTQQLSLERQVNFVGWIDHARLPAELRKYRAVVTPGPAEANGIVV